MPICYKIEQQDEKHRIIPGEFQIIKDMTIEDADERTLNTLALGNYCIALLECNVDCYREFFQKSSQFKQIGGNQQGTYYFVGLYHDIPVFVDVALNPEIMVVYRERKNVAIHPRGYRGFLAANK